MEKRTVGLSFGVMSDSISKQLRSQKLKFSKDKVSQFEKQIDAVHRLRFGDILTDGMTEKIFTRLHRKIMAHIAKENEMKIDRHG